MRRLPDMLKQRVESFNVGPSPDGEACVVKPVAHPNLPVEWTLDRFAAAELAVKLMDWLHSTHHEK